MKNSAATVLIWFFLLFVAGSSLNLYFKANSRANRLENNLATVNQQAEQFRARNGQLASRLTAQELTISELRRISPAIVSQIKNLYIPPRLVQSYTTTAQQMKAEITATVTSVQEPDTTGEAITHNPQPITRIDYADKWIQVKGTIKDDSAKLNITATDTIFCVIHKGERRRPWLWILSKRQYQASANNVSPYIESEIVNLGVIKK